MGKRNFHITFEGGVTIELDDRVIDVVDDEWRKDLYNIHTPEEIAKMVGLNLVHGWKLSSMDGWADQPDRNARILYFDEFKDVEVTECQSD